MIRFVISILEGFDEAWWLPKRAWKKLGGTLGVIWWGLVVVLKGQGKVWWLSDYLGELELRFIVYQEKRKVGVVVISEGWEDVWWYFGRARRRSDFNLKGLGGDFWFFFYCIPVPEWCLRYCSNGYLRLVKIWKEGLGVFGLRHNLVCEGAVSQSNISGHSIDTTDYIDPRYYEATGASYRYWIQVVLDDNNQVCTGSLY